MESQNHYRRPAISSAMMGTCFLFLNYCISRIFLALISTLSSVISAWGQEVGDGVSIISFSMMRCLPVSFVTILPFLFFSPFSLFPVFGSFENYILFILSGKKKLVIWNTFRGIFQCKACGALHRGMQPAGNLGHAGLRSRQLLFSFFFL